MPWSWIAKIIFLEVWHHWLRGSHKRGIDGKVEKAVTSRVREAGITRSKCGRFQRSKFQGSNDSIAGKESTKKELVIQFVSTKTSEVWIVIAVLVSEIRPHLAAFIVK